MGKRAAIETQVGAKSKPKRSRCSKTTNAKLLEFGNQSSYGVEHKSMLCTPPQFTMFKSTPITSNQSNKHANNSSIILKQTPTNTSPFETSHHIESPKPVYTLRPSLVNGTILKDLKKKLWRLGPPIGKGNFGEIFLASDNVGTPVNNENAKFVVKIEPHSNGPLFVEIHCLINTAKKFYNCDQMNTSRIVGIPPYIASGSHYFGDARYRFLVLPRFDCDLHAVIKNCRVKDACVLTLAVHVLDALEELHNQGYCHNDIKAQNIMITKKNAYKNLDLRNINAKNQTNYQKSDYEDIPHTTDSGNSSEVDENIEEKVKKHLRKNKKSNGTSNHVLNMDCYMEKNNYLDDDEMITTTTTTNSNDSNSLDPCFTPVSSLVTDRQRRRHVTVDYHGSNPVRSCRKTQNNDKNSDLYDEMVKSHYLRPRGRISYLEFFNENGGTGGGSDENSTAPPDSYFQSNNFNGHNDVSSTDDDDDDSEEFLPPATVRRSLASQRKLDCMKSKSNYRNNTKQSQSTCKRLTRRQEKILAIRGKEECARNSNNNNSLEHAENCFDMFGKNVEDQMFLIDFGLASKFMDNGIHRPFVMDQRRAHDGTLEFTSRDAHLGAHSRRSDLECLGYNMLFWSQGYLPWREEAQNHQQEKVHRAKEYLMTNVRTILKSIYGNQIPKFIGEYLHLIGQLGYQERPDYVRYRRLFERAYHQEERKGLAEGPMRLCRETIRKSCSRQKPAPKKDLTEKFEMINGSYFENGWNSKMEDSVRECSNFETPLKLYSTPFNDRVHSGNRVSPKNLRSKSTHKKACLKESKQIDSQSPTSNELSWSEILAQDPDQIARCRAEKEFEREEEMLVKSETRKARFRQFQGKPTYAILEMLRRRGMEYNPIKIELRVKRDADSTWRVALNHESIEDLDGKE